MILLVGASASGKTEVAKLLKSLFGIKKAITHTSRKIRPSEKDGVDYFFVTRERFKEAIENEELLEWTEFVGNYYGTPAAYVEKRIY